MYQAFGWEPPQFAHLPLLLNPNKTKLSKRQGDVSVTYYKASENIRLTYSQQEKGFLPEALQNFVAFLGWTPAGERELFSTSELIEHVWL